MGYQIKVNKDLLKQSPRAPGEHILKARKSLGIPETRGTYKSEVRKLSGGQKIKVLLKMIKILYFIQEVIRIYYNLFKRSDIRLIFYKDY